MTRKHTTFLIVSLMLAGMSLLFFSTRPAAAQDPKPTPSDDEVNRVAKQMYCPVCENIPLDVCPTQACQEWRDLIRLKLSDGWSDQQIKQYFAQQYGDRVLAEPPKTAAELDRVYSAWVAIAGGAVVVWRVLTLDAPARGAARRTYRGSRAAQHRG